MTVAHEYGRRPAAVPSSEPLSTMTTWSRTPNVGRRDSRQARVRSHWFQTGMTIVAGVRDMELLRCECIRWFEGSKVRCQSLADPASLRARRHHPVAFY